MPKPRLPSALARDAAESRQRGLLKPPGSLGRLEEIAVQFAGVRGHLETAPEPVVALAIFGADHGVAAAHVSAYPQEVTAKMIAAIGTGVAAVSALANQHRVDISLFDVGVATPVPPFRAHPRVRYTADRIADGTASFLERPAMTAEQRDRALQIGLQEAERLSREGTAVVAVGEVGIGNTTAAAALVCALCSLPAEDVVGRGTGISDEQLTTKIGVVDSALALHGAHTLDPLAILATFGGFELAAMTGFLLGAAAEGMLVVLDGFLSSAAAMVAVTLEPDVRGCLVASHESAEKGARISLARLGLEPLLRLGLRLGEGTGAVLGLSLVRDAICLEREMGTLASSGIR